jgi:nucleoside 2-deoxyribosyltransferase
MQSRIYLAGQCFPDQTWHDEVINSVKNVIYYDPRIIEENRKKNNITLDSPLINMHAITKQEIDWINESDLLFAYLKPDHAPLGTIIEIMHAFKKQIDIIIVDEKQTRATEWLHEYFKIVDKDSVVSFVHTMEEGIRLLKLKCSPPPLTIVKKKNKIKEFVGV